MMTVGFLHLTYSFLIVAFSGINLALVIHAASLDLILVTNLFDFSITLLALASVFSSKLCPRLRRLFRSGNFV
jgi:uncharacterized membrane protein